jgi:hypothetical protein
MVAWCLPDHAEDFGSNETLAEDTAFRNESLQGAYLVIAAGGPGAGLLSDVRF